MMTDLCNDATIRGDAPTLCYHVRLPLDQRGKPGPSALWARVGKVRCERVSRRSTCAGSVLGRTFRSCANLFLLATFPWIRFYRDSSQDSGKVHVHYFSEPSSELATCVINVPQIIISRSRCVIGDGCPDITVENMKKQVEQGDAGKAPFIHDEKLC